MPFPATRLRRLRKTGVLRDMVRETELSPARLVHPMFVQLGEGRSPIEQVMRHLNETPEPIGSRSAFPVPDALETVLMQCLAKEPAGRYASAAVYLGLGTATALASRHQ